MKASTKVSLYEIDFAIPFGIRFSQWISCFHLHTRHSIAIPFQSRVSEPFFQDKAAIKAEVDVLLSLKAQFKEATGMDWKPGQNPAPVPAPPTETTTGGATATSSTESKEAVALKAKIEAQGEVVRDLKSKGADKVGKAWFGWSTPPMELMSEDTSGILSGDALEWEITQHCKKM